MHNVTPEEACWDCANRFAARRPDPGPSALVQLARPREAARCPRQSRYWRGGDCPHTRPRRAKPEEKVYRWTRQRRASSLQGSWAIDKIGVYSPSEWWWRDLIQYPPGGSKSKGRLTEDQEKQLESDHGALRKPYGDGDRRGACGAREGTIDGELGQARRQTAVVEEFCPHCQKQRTRFSVGRSCVGGFDCCQTCRGVPTSRDGSSPEQFQWVLSEAAASIDPDEVNRDGDDGIPGFE